MKHLNRRIPVSYYFVPPATVEVPQYPALWGWDPRPGGDPGTEQKLHFSNLPRMWTVKATAWLVGLTAAGAAVGFLAGQLLSWSF